MTTFFSVDVETSGLTPGTGALLTVGIQPVSWSAPGDGPLAYGASFMPTSLYVRIDRSFELGSWKPGNPTFDWWADQSDEARGEAFADTSLVRHPAETAAAMISEFVRSTEGTPDQRVFVANPVAFDKMWLVSLFDEAEVEDPFHYRSLCLRSMKFGLRPRSKWGSDRENHEPVIPHHALHDAVAQAHDLLDMLAERDFTERRT
jgi:hypothetical protein